jgi:hypothetical protein
MQQRRYRPGDVLDDYCPRERRITDHAIVAMIEDDIKQTRCVVCDAEHEYKDGKVPAQRRKKPQAALFTQVLEGLQGPQPSARLSNHSDTEPARDEVQSDRATAASGLDEPADTTTDVQEEDESAPAMAASAAVTEAHASEQVPRDDRPWRRQLIRASFPRPEGQAPPLTRPAPEFTVRQPNSRGPRHGRRRGGGGHPGHGGMDGPMRFGRDGHGPGGQRQRSGRSRRRGKKR